MQTQRHQAYQALELNCYGMNRELESIDTFQLHGRVRINNKFFLELEGGAENKSTC